MQMMLVRSALASRRLVSVSQGLGRQALAQPPVLARANALVLSRGMAKKAGKEKPAADKSNAKGNAGTAHADEKAVKDALVAVKGKMKDSLDRFEKKMATIRPGGLDAALLEGIIVEISGKKVPLGTLGMISAPSPLKLNVTLNERENASAVEKAISGSGLNVQARKLEDTGIVEVPVPKTTKEQRDSRIKLAGEEAEKIKVALRGVRQDALKAIKKMGLSEDETKKTEKQLQTMLDGAIEKATELLDKKKKDLAGANVSKD